MPRDRRGNLPWFAALSLLALSVPGITQDSYYLHVGSSIALSIILATSLRLILTTGLLSIAHAGFMGIGAYTSALLVMRAGFSFWLALPLAGLMATLVSIPVGYLTLRIKGPYFFLVTFAFAEALRLIFNNFWVSMLGGPRGIVGVPTPDPLSLWGWVIAFRSKVALYYLAVVLALLTLAIMYRLDRSRPGRIFGAIRQSDDLAESVGIGVLRYKMLAFSVACFFAGLGGSFFAHSHSVLHADEFGLSAVILMVIHVVVGGAGSVFGPVIGATTLTVLSELLRGLRHYQLLAYGTALIATMLFVPEGLAGIPKRLARWRAPRTLVERRESGAA
ncbi:MAG: branched-chain amino acid ABC transporter permease [Candidatus Rokubacteria bacterium]|nr:branched-chain amino acid ABC transporter permease [Candidatus Rokubacteria bacterium]